MIYICIPVYNRINYTRKCLQSIRKQVYQYYKVIICDDGSTDNTSKILLKEFPEVLIVEGDGNLWWTGGINKCVELALTLAAKGDFIFTLNNDTELESDTLQILIDFVQPLPGCIVACGNYFIDSRDKLESTAFLITRKFPLPMYHKAIFKWGEDIKNLNEKVFRVSSVSGKGVLIPVEVFWEIGIYDFNKLPHYHADTEFTRRAFNAGFNIYYNLNAKIFTDQTTTGIGQVNSPISLKEFFISFGSLRSENHFRSLLNRAKLFYGRKWVIYFIPNLVSIIVKFFIRYYHNLKAYK